MGLTILLDSCFRDYAKNLVRLRWWKTQPPKSPLSGGLSTQFPLSGGGFPLNSPLIRGARGVKNDERWVSCTVSKVPLPVRLMVRQVAGSALTVKLTRNFYSMCFIIAEHEFQANHHSPSIDSSFCKTCWSEGLSATITSSMPACVH